MMVTYFEKWFWYKRIGIRPLSIVEAKERHECNQAYVALVDRTPEVLVEFYPHWVSVSFMDDQRRAVAEFGLNAQERHLRLKSAKRRVFKDDAHDPSQFTMINLNADGGTVGAETFGVSEVFSSYVAAGPALERPEFGAFDALLHRVSACSQALEAASAREASLLRIVADSSLGDDYYRLCSAHPVRVEAPPRGLSATPILKAASGRIALAKLPGGGHGYEVGAMGENVALTLVIQGRTSVETDFSIPFQSSAKVGTAATLCHEASMFAGQPLQSPPYPRPDFRSPDEFVEIALELRAWVIALAAAAKGAAR